MKIRNYSFVFDGIEFHKDDKRGMFKNGELKNGCLSHNYVSQYLYGSDGKLHPVCEHIAKWIFFNGEIPEGMEIDHINGDKADNRLENLRCITHCANCNNTNTKHKISDALKGKPLPQSTIDKLKGRTPWNKGKTNIYSDETKQKMSNAAKINNAKRDRNNLGQFVS